MDLTNHRYITRYITCLDLERKSLEFSPPRQFTAREHAVRTRVCSTTAPSLSNTYSGYMYCTLHYSKIRPILSITWTCIDPSISRQQTTSITHGSVCTLLIPLPRSSAVSLKMRIPMDLSQLSENKAVRIKPLIDRPFATRELHLNHSISPKF